jgi:hypothetical protein
MSNRAVNRKSAAACIFLALSGCASPGPACPPVVAYTPAEQQQAAAELRAKNVLAVLAEYERLLAKPEGACEAGDQQACRLKLALLEARNEEVAKMIADYGTMRDRVRSVCK